MNTMRERVPNWLKASVRAARAVAYSGEGRFCPICEKSARRFLTVGREVREDAQCPHCLSTERHRFVQLYLSRKTDLFDHSASQLVSQPASQPVSQLVSRPISRPASHRQSSQTKPVLHVSPARCLETKLKKCLSDRYITADLFNPSAMVKMDITDIHYPDQSFSIILCSHVLEHVDDDIAAMKEFYRVLKDDGWAILLVPITCDRTFEDPSVTEPSKRLELFGEVDHVRRYGPDYIDRLRSAGFQVEKIGVEEVASSVEIERMRLTEDSGDIYLCRRSLQKVDIA